MATRQKSGAAFLRRLRGAVPLRRLFCLGVLFTVVTSCVRPRNADLLSLTASVFPVAEKELRFPGSEKGTLVEGHLVRPDAPGRFPCAVLLHGRGGWWQAYLGYARELARRGLSALILDYYSAHYVSLDSLDVPFEQRRRQFELQNEDIARSVARFARTAYCTGGRIGLVGFSLGADKAFRVAAARPEVRAIVAYYGPYDYVSFIRHRMNRVLLALAGEDALRWKDYLEKNSPILAAGRVRGDVLLFHGIEDTLIPMNQSVRMYAALRRRNGYRTRAVYYEGVGHNFVIYRASRGERTDSIARALAFLVRNLPPAQSAENAAPGEPGRRGRKPRRQSTILRDKPEPRPVKPGGSG